MDQKMIHIKETILKSHERVYKKKWTFGLFVGEARARNHSFIHSVQAFRHGALSISYYLCETVSYVAIYANWNCHFRALCNHKWTM
jgi:hypothetical protein